MSKRNFQFFTPREVETLAWLEHGMSNKCIASRMGVKERTIKNHLQNIQSKADVYGRFNLILWIFSGKWRKHYRMNKWSKQ